MSLFYSIILLYFMFLLSGCSQSSSNNTKQPIHVTVQTVNYKEQPILLETASTLSTDFNSRLSTQAPGILEAYYFKNGDLVQKGQLLFQLNDQQEQAELQGALAQLELSTVTYQRNLQLYRQNNLSREELDQALETYRTALSQANSLKAQIANKHITAPFSGIIGERLVNLGQFINTGDTMVTLVNIDNMKVNYCLPETDLPYLKQGQTVILQIAARPQSTFQGEVTYIAPTITLNNRSICLQATIPNPKNLLLPGMFANLQQQIGTQKVMLLPASAVKQQDQRFYVYTVEQGKALQKFVTLGKIGLEQVSILSGLQAGEQVITDTTNIITPNSPVKAGN